MWRAREHLRISTKRSLGCVAKPWLLLFAAVTFVSSYPGSPRSWARLFPAPSSRLTKWSTRATVQAVHPPMQSADQGAGFWDFWMSPVGLLRQQYLGSSGMPALPQAGILAPWVHSDDVYEIVPHQVERDIEQFEYLVAEGVLSAELEDYVVDVVLPEFRRMLTVATMVVDGRSDIYFMTHPQTDFAVYFSLQKRALHVHDGEAVAEGAVNPIVSVEGYPMDLAAVESEFLQKDHRVAVMDGFFSAAALERLRDFLLQSTFWTEMKFGHVGAYLEAGFACPLVAQIDKDLRASMPRIFEGLELETAWAYMYDGSLGGVNTHADDAQVQINFFITPTEANLGLNESGVPDGGLVLYGVGPPAEWGKEKYNNVYGKAAIEEVIASSGYANLTVPYVQNRAILFDSTYFHRSDGMKFKKGYKNRRINVTFLYGKRNKLQARPAASFGSGVSSSGRPQAPWSKQSEHFYTQGDNWLSDHGWAMIRELNV